MQTTCLYCGLTTQITPDQPRCTECGGDLEALITPEHAGQFYYERAKEQAYQGDAKQALSTIRQGLSEIDSADLHLLAAILHQRLGEFDQMRAHVAAIPVGDALRPEGEWLLRAHQARQSRGRRRVQTENDALAVTPFGQVSKAQKRAQPRRRGLWALPVATVLMLTALGWWGWQSGALDAGLQQVGIVGIPGLTQSSPPASASSAEPVAPLQEEAAPVQQEATPTQELVAPTPAPLPTTPPRDDLVQAPAQPEPAAAQPASTTAAASRTEDETADAEILEASTASAAPEPSPVASRDQADVAALAESAELDLAQLLTDLGEAELADLPVTASRSGGEIQLTGSVSSAAQRTRLIETLSAAPGVTEVDALNLVVRVDKVYVTKPGDNLWRIADALYGDGRRWREIYDLNREILGNNPGAIYANMELNLPPMQ